MITAMQVSFELILLFSTTSIVVTAFDSSTASVLSDSVRQQLIETSQRINPVGYASPGWSNRAATVLTPITTTGVYTADRPFYWNKIDVSCRSTVIELPHAAGEKPDLWIHSPVALDAPMQSLVTNLGTVKYVVSSNYEHLKYAPQWHEGFPDAHMWGCPGLAARMPNIQFTGEVPYQYRPVNWKAGSTSFDDAAVIGWDTAVIQALHIHCEVNPATGKPFFNEVIFYHVPSKTLIVTDFFWNYPADAIANSQFGRDDTWELAPVVGAVPTGSKLWKFGMDRIYSPFYQQFMVKDKAEYRAIVDHILNVWDVEIVIPAHGDILRGKEFIRDVLTKHFGV